VTRDQPARIVARVNRALRKASEDRLSQALVGTLSHGRDRPYVEALVRREGKKYRNLLSD